VMDIPGEIMTGAEAKIDIVAPKVCTIHRLDRHVRNAHKIQNMLHHDQITLAENRDHVHQLATAPVPLRALGLLHEGRGRSAIDHHIARSSMMKTSVRPSQSQPRPNRRLSTLNRKRPTMARKMLW
jgi:hypothetical protein